MKPSSSLSDFIIFSILISLPLHLQAKKVSVEQNCKRISNANISQASCLEYFKADPGSKNTNLHVLGAIAFKRTVQNAADVQSVIQGHIGSDSSDVARITNSAMKNCLAYYQKVAEPAKEALKKYEAKEYRDSAALVRQLDSAPSDCEKECNSKQVQSPLGPDNEGFRLNVLISSRIADLLAAKKSKRTGQTTGRTASQATSQTTGQTTSQTTGQTTPVSPASPKEDTGDNIDSNCYQLAPPLSNVSHDFCVKALMQEPALKSTFHIFKVTGLVYKLTVTNATGMVSTIQNHLKSASGAVKSSLEDCLEFYNDKLTIAKNGLSLFEKEDYRKSKEESDKLPEAATMCEDTFTEQKVQSPLTKENENFKKLSTMLCVGTDLVFQNAYIDEEGEEKGPDEA